jgi:hypothetical protein
MTDEGSGAVGCQELSVAESPKHADTGQPTITRRHDVNIAVTDIDGPLLVAPQLAQGFADGIGGRLLVHSGTVLVVYIGHSVTGGTGHTVPVL